MRIGTVVLALLVSTACGGITDYDAISNDTGDDSFGLDDTNDTVDTNDTNDTNDTVDTDTNDTQDTDTQDTSPTESPPQLVSFDARESSGLIELAFRVTDADQDLSGGSITVAVDGAPTTYAIPGDIDFWNPNGESKIYITPAGCDSASHSYSATVKDAAGNQSTSLSDSLALSSAGVAVPEVGDSDYDVWSGGVASLPSSYCADIHTASNNGTDSYDGDIDFFEIEFNSSGYVTFQLTWDAPTGDYDLHLFDADGYFIASSIQDGPTQPETLNYSVFSGEMVFVMVAGWSGGAGNYRLTVQ